MLSDAEPRAAAAAAVDVMRSLASTQQTVQTTDSRDCELVLVVHRACTTRPARLRVVVGGTTSNSSRRMQSQRLQWPIDQCSPVVTPAALTLPRCAAEIGFALEARTSARA